MTTQALNQTLNETLNHTSPFSIRVRQIARMRVGTNLERKSVAESKSCRSVVVGEPLPSPRGELLEEGAEQNEERKKKWGKGEGRHDNQVVFNGRHCGRQPLAIKAMVVIHNADLWQILKFKSCRCGRQPLNLKICQRSSSTTTVNATMLLTWPNALLWSFFLNLN